MTDCARSRWWVAVGVLLSLIAGRDRGWAAGASACRRSCRTQAAVCAQGARAAFVAALAACPEHGPARRTCVNAARDAHRIARAGCHVHEGSCRTCCLGGGTACGAYCGDGVVSPETGEACD